VPTYFCDPYSSWQKGAVENVNKMIRRYVPKGTDVRTVSQEYLDFVAERINEKPRAILGFRSAYEVDAAGRASLKRLECPN
jgi:IS30 family transposase